MARTSLKARRLAPGKLVIATHNPGKLTEISALVVPFGMTTLSAGELGLIEPEEDGATFLDNVRIKAHAAAQVAMLPALADDSGLCVTALNGQPGIHSARWAGPRKDFRLAMERVQLALGDSGDRRATFVCWLALAWPDGHEEVFEGTVRGNLTWPPLGERGFGYDPIFIPEGHNLTCGEMEPDAKHAISHRAVAFNKLVAACLQAEAT